MGMDGNGMDPSDAHGLRGWLVGMAVGRRFKCDVVVDLHRLAKMVAKTVMESSTGWACA